jgi:DNA-binding SARP family transcriptional activator
MMSGGAGAILRAVPDPTVRLELTGAPRAHAGGRSVELMLHDALLLAWLVLEGPTSRERLAALLWPASSADAARNALRQRLFRLRRTLGCDAVAGAALLALADGVQHDLAGATALLGSLADTGSPPLDDWLAARRSTHEAQARQALAQRIEALEAGGDAAAALPLALRLLQSDPLSEDSHRRVMRLHYLLGDRAAAVLAFDRCEQVLKHEVGTAPSRATLDLLAVIESSDAPAGATRQPVPAAVLRPPRLVGRAAELALLRQGLAGGHVVVLLGEAGMGKSRLLQALAAAQPGVVHASGRPGDSLVPYATLARALRQLLDRDPAVADPALRRALAPLLPEWLPPDAPARAMQPPLAQPVGALLQRLARQVDTLALDDLHFADDATLELLQTLLAAPRDGPAPLRWCLGLRPAAPGSRLQGLLDALATAGPHTRLALQPLTEAQMAELVDSLALPGVAGSAVAAALHQRSGGNPLFALETLKLAWNDGTLLRAGELPRPASLAQLIAQQLARLSAPALQLARVAAVAGVDFSLPLATSLLGRNALELADAWAELEAQQVLRGDAFAHDLIHDAVLQGLPEIIARHLHGQTAARLEAQGGEAARIAAHWEAAGQRARALPALRQAAEHAHRALREGERIAFLLHAADIAEAAGRRDEAWTLVRSALEGHMNTIRQADGLPLLDRLQALASTPLQAARVAGDRAWYATVLGDFDAALELGAQALHQALPLGDAGLVATIRQRLGTMLGMVGRFAQALPHMRAAEPWIESHAAPDALSEFHGNLAVVLDNLGRPAQAQQHHLRALALSAAPGDQAQQATQRANYASSRLDAGDLAGASEQAAQAQLIVSTYEMAGSSAGYIATLQAQCERAHGRYTAALHWCGRAESILAERNPSRVPVARLHRAQVWLDLGQHARALQELGGGALDTSRRLPPRYAVRWLVLLARVQRRLRQDPAPRLAEALALTPDEGWPELRLIVRTEQALALDSQDALAELRDLAAEAQAQQLHGAELAALLHATALAAHHDPAAAPALAHATLALAATAEALHADRALRWLAPALALAEADPARAAALAREGHEWLRTTAAAHVAPEFADSFLHQHPVNAALLGWRPGP